MKWYSKIILHILGIFLYIPMATFLLLYLSTHPQKLIDFFLLMEYFLKGDEYKKQCEL